MGVGGGNGGGGWVRLGWDLRFLSDPTGGYGPFLFASNFLVPRVEEVLIWEAEVPQRPGALEEVMVLAVADGASVVFNCHDLG